MIKRLEHPEHPEHQKNKKSGEKTKNESPPVGVYPNFYGWGPSELRAWKRCLNCEWAWWVNGAHVCLDQNAKRADYAMKSCGRTARCR